MLFKISDKIIKWIAIVNIALFATYFIYRVAGIAIFQTDTFLSIIKSDYSEIILLSWMFSLVVIFGVIGFVREKIIFSLYFWKIFLNLSVLFCAGYLIELSKLPYYLLPKTEFIYEIIRKVALTASYCLIFGLMWYQIFKANQGLSCIENDRLSFINNILGLLIIFFLSMAVCERFMFLMPDYPPIGIVVYLFLFLYAHTSSVYLMLKRIDFLSMAKFWKFLSAVPIINIPLLVALMIKKDLKNTEIKVQIILSLSVLFIIGCIKFYSYSNLGSSDEVTSAIYGLFQNGSALYLF